MKMVILSIDLGKARTGIAVSDKYEVLATPVCTIKEKDSEKLLTKVLQIINETSAKEIVIGLPINMDGSKGDSAQNAINFANELKKLSDLNIIMQDERCTTVSAHRYLNNTNTRGKKRKDIVDSVAATIILQSYLDGKHNQ